MVEKQEDHLLAHFLPYNCIEMFLDILDCGHGGISCTIKVGGTLAALGYGSFPCDPSLGGSVGAGTLGLNSRTCSFGDSSSGSSCVLTMPVYRIGEAVKAVKVADMVEGKACRKTKDNPNRRADFSYTFRRQDLIYLWFAFMLKVAQIYP